MFPIDVPLGSYWIWDYQRLAAQDIPGVHTQIDFAAMVPRYVGSAACGLCALVFALKPAWFRRTRSVMFTALGFVLFLLIIKLGGVVIRAMVIEALK